EAQLLLLCQDAPNMAVLHVAQGLRVAAAAHFQQLRRTKKTPDMISSVANAHFVCSPLELPGVTKELSRNSSQEHSRFAAHGQRKARCDFAHQFHLFSEFFAAEAQRRPGNASGCNHSALCGKNRSGDARESALEFLAVDGVAALPRAFEFFL